MSVFANQAYAGLDYLENLGGSPPNQSVSVAVPAHQEEFESSCFIPALQAHKMKESGWLLVDIRKNQLFNEYRVPSSINLPLHSLASRTFLRNKKIILIGDGFHMQEVSTICKIMRKNGFHSIYAIFGGMLAWTQSKLPVEGNLPKSIIQASIPVDRFFQQQNLNYWQMINLSPSHQHEWVNIFPYLKLDNRTENSINLNQQKEHSPFKAVILINEDGRYEEKDFKYRNNSMPMYVLAGGMNAFQKYSDKLLLMKSYLLHGSQQIKKCGY